MGSSELGTSVPQVQQGSLLISRCTGMVSKSECGRGFMKGTNGGLLGYCWGAGYMVCSSWKIYSAIHLRSLKICTSF